MMKADVYSVGGCLLALLLACQPFCPPVGLYQEHMAEAKRHILMKKDKNFIQQLVQLFDPSLRQLLLRVLEPEPQNRITIDELLADDWFSRRFQSQELEESWSQINWRGLPQQQWTKRRQTK